VCALAAAKPAKGTPRRWAATTSTTTGPGDPVDPAITRNFTEA